MGLGPTPRPAQLPKRAGSANRLSPEGSLCYQASRSLRSMIYPTSGSDKS